MSTAAISAVDWGSLCRSYGAHWRHLSISYAWMALYAVGPLAADDEASMFELVLPGIGVLLFCLLIAMSA
jgi:hypothetical protein